MNLPEDCVLQANATLHTKMISLKKLTQMCQGIDSTNQP